MKRLLGIISLALLVLLAVFSCRRDELPVKFNLKTDRVEFTAEGGKGTIAYELENPREELAFTVKCEEGIDWVANFDFSVDGEISFMIAANNDPDKSRATSVTITYGTISRSFTVSQDAAPEFAIEQESVKVDAQGGKANVTYTLENPIAGLKIEASSKEEWVKDFDTSVDGKISFTVESHDAMESRYAMVTATYGGTSKTFVVIQGAQQAPEDPVLTIDQKSVQIGAEGGKANVTYTLENPVDGLEIEVFAEEDWVKDLKSSNGKISFTADANELFESRYAQVTVTYGELIRSFIVIQAAKQAPDAPSLTLSEKSVQISADGGNGSVDYTLQNPADGVKLEASSEERWVSELKCADGKVTFTVQANDKFESRYSQITVSYGELVRSFIIVQNAKQAPEDPVLNLDQESVEITAEGGAAYITYTLENPVDELEIEASSQAEWIKVFNTSTSGKISFYVDANQLEESRFAQASVKYGKIVRNFIVIQDAKHIPDAPEPVLEIVDKSVKVSHEETFATVTYTISDPLEGVTIVPSAEEEWVKDFDTSVDGKLTFRIEANPAEESRYAQISLTYGKIVRNFIVIQSAKPEPETPPAPVLTIVEESVEMTHLGGEASVTYTLENPVEGLKIAASTKASWIKNFNTSTDGKISFTVDSNPIEESRFAQVTITYGELVRNFIIIQDAKPAPEKPAHPTLTINQESVEMTHQGGNASVTYTLENPLEGVSITASSDAGWIKNFNTSVDGKITFTVEANSAEESRFAQVSVSYSKIVRTFIVIQDAKPAPAIPVLSLDQESVRMAHEGGDANVTYTLKNPVEGTAIAVTTQEGWIGHFDTTVDGKISFTVDANEVEEARFAQVSVSYGNITRTFIVIQDAKPEDTIPTPTLTLNQESVEMPAEGGSANVTYTLTNPVEGISITASTQQQWVKDIDTSVEGKISFGVEANPAEEARFAQVSVNYGEIVRTFIITQRASVIPDAPVLTFEPETVEAIATGGTFTVRYSIENPVDGAVVEPSTQAQWISGFDISTEGEITFNVADNTTSDKREGIITVKYSTIEATISVIQSMPLSLTITVREVGADNVIADIIPNDEKATYIVAIADKSVKDEFYDDEAFFSDDIANFEANAQALGITLSEFLRSRMLLSGESIGRQFNGLDNGTEYYIYAYGLTEEAVRTSAIVKETFTIYGNADLRYDVGYCLNVSYDSPDFDVYEIQFYKQDFTHFTFFQFSTPKGELPDGEYEVITEIAQDDKTITHTAPGQVYLRQYSPDDYSSLSCIAPGGRLTFTAGSEEDHYTLEFEGIKTQSLILSGSFEGTVNNIPKKIGNLSYDFTSVQANYESNNLLITYNADIWSDPDAPFQSINGVKLILEEDGVLREGVYELTEEMARGTVVFINNGDLVPIQNGTTTVRIPEKDIYELETILYTKDGSVFTARYTGAIDGLNAEPKGTLAFDSVESSSVAEYNPYGNAYYHFTATFTSASSEYKSLTLIFTHADYMTENGEFLPSGEYTTGNAPFWMGIDMETTSTPQTCVLLDSNGDEVGFTFNKDMLNVERNDQSGTYSITGGIIINGELYRLSINDLAVDQW